MLIYMYMGAGLVTAIAAFVASPRIAIVLPSRTVRISTSVVAGALWPIMLVGLAQVGVVLLYVKYAAYTTPFEEPADQYFETALARF
jgi:hypothetical protein